MNDELRERAKVWLSKQGKVRILDYTFTSHLMADFAAEAVRAERERLGVIVGALADEASDGVWDALRLLGDELREAK